MTEDAVADLTAHHAPDLVIIRSEGPGTIAVHPALDGHEGTVVTA